MSNIIFLTVSETAEILRIHPKTVQRYLRLGKLPGIKLGRVWRVPKQALLSMAEAVYGVTAEPFAIAQDKLREQKEPEYLSTAEIIALAEERAKELAFRNRHESIAQYQQLLEAIEVEARNKGTDTKDYPDDD